MELSPPVNPLLTPYLSSKLVAAAKSEADASDARTVALVRMLQVQTRWSFHPLLTPTAPHYL
jgi:hypothetical protein